MAGSGAEKDPEGLPQPWFGLWRQALKAMKDQESWTPEQRPLLDLYIAALRLAGEAADDEREIDHDRHAKRASSLADQLALTPRGRKAAGLVDDIEQEQDGFARFAPPDELAPRRAG
jgi:phage terminase small subunit